MVRSSTTPLTLLPHFDPAVHCRAALSASTEQGKLTPTNVERFPGEIIVGVPYELAPLEFRQASHLARHPYQKSTARFGSARRFSGQRLTSSNHRRPESHPCRTTEASCSWLRSLSAYCSPFEVHPL